MIEQSGICGEDESGNSTGEGRDATSLRYHNDDQDEVVIIVIFCCEKNNNEINRPFVVAKFRVWGPKPHRLIPLFVAAQPFVRQAYSIPTLPSIP